MTLSKRLREQFEELAHLRGVENKTFEEAAKLMGVSSRTLKRWVKSPDYKALIQELRSGWGDDSQTMVKGIAVEQIANLRWLALNARSEHVRYEASAKLGQWAGLEDKEEQIEEDDRTELERLYHILQKRKSQALGVTVNVALPPGSQITVPQAPGPHVPLLEEGEAEIEAEDASFEDIEDYEEPPVAKASVAMRHWRRD